MSLDVRMSSVEQRLRLEKLGIPRETSSKMTEAEASAAIVKQTQRRSERRKKAAKNKKEAEDLGKDASKRILRRLAAPKATPHDGDANDRLCTKRRDGVPAMVKALVLELEVESGGHVFAHEVIRDAISEALQRARSRRERKLLAQIKSSQAQEPPRA